MSALYRRDWGGWQGYSEVWIPTGLGYLRIMASLTYKQLLSAKLTKHRWEIVAIEYPEDWFVKERWQISSQASDYDKKIVLSFMVDAQDETLTLVDEIVASRTPLLHRLDDTSNIAVLDMLKGLFNEKLCAFIEQLNLTRTSTAK